MGDDFDAFVNDLQEKIFQEAREAYGEIGYRRWREPLHMGVTPNPDGYARVTGVCGDTMEIFLKMDGDRVAAASFITNGCGASTICGSFAAELAIGKTPDEVMDITGDSILNIFGVFPEEDRHCAFLAANTLHEALGDCMKRRLDGG